MFIYICSHTHTYKCAYVRKPNACIKNANKKCIKNA